MSHPSLLATLLAAASAPTAIATRAGAYAPDLNVWVCRELLDGTLQAADYGEGVLEGFAALAIASGALHLRQLADARGGRVWPRAWIESADGAALLALAERAPGVGSAFACVHAEEGAVPYTVAYRPQLTAVVQAIDDLLALADPAARTALDPLVEFLAGLRRALTDEELYLGPHATLDIAEVAWLQIPDAAQLLPLMGFTENYADPLKPHIQQNPAVQAWAKSVSAQTGLPPWKTFFEFRLFDRIDGVVNPAEIGQIEAAIRRFYTPVSDQVPAAQTGTEFRRVIFCGGHGAHPPKSAKNYPNQDWIRQQHGYRNILFFNQVEDKVQTGVIPALQACFATEWANRPDMATRILRAHTLFLISHELSHPWLQFGELSWLEEMKCDVLGLNALLNSPEFAAEADDILIARVAADLHQYRRYHALAGQEAAQIHDYYVGNTIFVSHLLKCGFFRLDAHGQVVDIDLARGKPLIAELARRILAIHAGEETPAALYAEHFHDAEVYGRFGGLHTPVSGG
jgi:hypothetical protein